MSNASSSPAAPHPAPAAGLSSLDAAFLTSDDGATELVLVRHGQQVLTMNGTGPAGGNLDAPLSELGREQARLVGERMASERVDIVYASPLQRAYDTADQIAKHHGLTPIVDDHLREIEVFRDVPEGRSVVDVIGVQRLLGIRQRFARDLSWDVYPMSESSAEFRNRVVNVIEGIMASHPGQRIVIGCHGGVITTYLGWTLGISRDMWFRPGHTSLNVLRARDQVRAVQRTNDLHHLAQVSPELVTH